MDPQVSHLRVQIAVLHERLNTALREKVSLEQALLQVAKILPGRLAADSGFPVARPVSRHYTEEEKVQNPPKHSCHGVVEVTEDLLDSPPELDLPMSGAKTDHDRHSIGLEPLGSSAVTVPSETSHLLSTATASFSSSSHWETQTKTEDQSALSSFQTHPKTSLVPIGPHPHPSFYTHGIRYSPPGDIERKFQRVLITGLPSGASAASLLNKVHGGTIVSCELMDTVKLIGSMTAMIRFKDEAEASGFVQRTIHEPLDVQDQKATVILIETPTYPLSYRLYHNIHSAGHTRCLKVYKFSRLYGLRGIHFNNWAKHAIEFMRIAPDGILFMRFTSIQVASVAREFFLSFSGITSNDVTFLPDPCAYNQDMDEPIRDSSNEASSESEVQTPSTSPTIVPEEQAKIT